MADIPSTGPDNYVELVNQQTPSHIEQKVGPEYGKLNFEVGGVVFDMKNNLITILESPEVKEKPKKEIEELKSEVSGELIGEAKEQFINKLQNLPDYEGSKIQEAIEKQTIEIKKIPSYSGYELKFNEDGYAEKVDVIRKQKLAISLDGSNVDIITFEDGTIYFNLTTRRNNDAKQAAFNGFTGIQEKNIDGINYIIENGKQYEVFSQEYYDILLEKIEHINNFSKVLISIDFDEQKLKENIGGELIGEAKEQFINKLQDLTDYEGSKVQEAIEKQTIEIKKIPGRDGYAIYESKIGNLVYITKLDGNEYLNLENIRKNDLFGKALQGGYKKYGYKEIQYNSNNGLWILFNKKGEKVSIYSDEYSLATLNAANYMLDFLDKIMDEIDRRGIK